MTRKITALLLALLICLSLASCGSSTKEDANTGTDSENTAPDTQEQKELSEPVLLWWELYNPNGFDTVAGLIENPNDIPVDVSYDLVYYSNGTEIARTVDFSNIGILPGGQDLLWANYDVPESTGIDEVRLENVVTAESYYDPIPCSCEFTVNESGIIECSYEFEKEPEFAYFWIVLYSDNNGNGKHDMGELTTANIYYAYDQKGVITLDDLGSCSFTDLDAYVNAY